jgi:tetratricopeptide (TPR) repeat protein
MLARRKFQTLFIRLLIITAIACGICEAVQKKPAQTSTGTISQSVKKGPKTPSAAANKAFNRAFTIEKQNPKAAKKLYESNIKLFPDDYRNYARLGALLAKNPATKKLSETYLKKASSFADVNPPIWLYLAKVYRSLGNENGELAAYRAYLAVDSLHADANARLGQILLEKGKRQEGIPFIQRALAKDSSNPVANFTLANIYLKDSRTEEAVPLLQKTLRVDSTNSEARKKLISAYLQLHRDTAAADEMKKTLAAERTPAVLLTYSRLLLKIGKLTEAANAVEDLLAVIPDTFPALMLKVEILKQQKNYDGILTVCKEIGYIDAHYVPALYERAEAYRQQGKVMWAEKYYRDALKANPKFARAEIGLAEIAKARDKPDDYRKHVMLAYKLNPVDSVVVEKYQEAMAQ